jgi:uncharacterized YccA/Bax inhibitor family protein
MASANPAMSEEVFRRAGRADTRAAVMTLQGSVLKTAILVMILLVTGAYAWSLFDKQAPGLGYGLLIGASIGGLVFAFVTIFFPRAAPITAPIYAGLEGVVLGTISAVFEAMYPGIVVQAVSLSVGVLAVMLFVYGTGIIRATERFKIGVVAATGAVCLVYLATWILSFFNVGVPYIHGSGPIGIGFSVIVVIIAALNLILDFDFIEQGVRYQAPRYMEWYAGFSLLVTLVWMYLEILRLLAKLKGESRG